ncbi:DUF1659 domain-containing protein [Clostridium tarantellae]|uniref:DUF1659 domain-containing protein n=1 Tax=Clostridium tarantellae TaxID=39493 RepID=A0A6I1MMK9_9CLOT|nr:DUF1659 domain-containing protein [Clostridium tarantellae]MPQ44200.1 DUF1659 domain-containing protein [Clostridium tarantellae]
MASFIKNKRSFSLEYQIGVDDKGNPVFFNEKFDNVKVTATDDQIYTLGNAVATVLVANGAKVKVKDSYGISTEI